MLKYDLRLLCNFMRHFFPLGNETRQVGCHKISVSSVHCRDDGYRNIRSFNPWISFHMEFHDGVGERQENFGSVI